MNSLKSKKIFGGLLLIVGFFGFVSFADASVSVATEQMTVCSYDKASTCMINDYSQVYIPESGYFGVIATTARGTHNDECQAHEEFSAFIDGQYYFTSHDPDSCEAGDEDIYRRETYPTTYLTKGNHMISIKHLWADNADTAESVSVLIAFVTEVEAPDAPTCSVTVNDASITEGDTVTFTWSSTNATSASFDNGIGSVSTSGSGYATPTSSSTYTATFTGDGGSTSCSVYVEVVNKPAPTCSVSTNDSSIENGESATITWSSSNTTSVSFDNSIGSVSTSGSKTVSPTTSTTYTGTFTGDGGSTSCSVYIDVNQPEDPVVPEDVSCSLNISPSTINAGETAVITWSSTNANSASIDNSVGSVSTSGSVSITPSSTTTYTGTFVGDDETEVCSASITVNPVTTTTTTGGGGGGGGIDQPNVSMTMNALGTPTTSVDLSQIPYTGIPQYLIDFFGFIFRFVFFGGLLFAYYKISKGEEVNFKFKN